MTKETDNKFAGLIKPKSGKSTREFYEHQQYANDALNTIDKEDSFSTLIVIPTGGGKTYTISKWLTSHALRKGNKVLWLAHRYMLLDQAADAFKSFVTNDDILNPFYYRIVSGNHNRPNQIQPTDNLLICGKDSIGRGLSNLDKWLQDEDVIYIVIDEAHHAVAKTYRRVIDYVKQKVKNIKLIGITATPYRTAENEKGLLSKIFSDGLENNRVVKGKVGISYQISLQDLINKHILSTPKFFDISTDVSFNTLSPKQLEEINRLDILPTDVQENLAKNSGRNNLVVNTYLKHKDEFGQTIVFVININNAIYLNQLFKDAGIRSAFVVSDITDSVTGVNITKKDNEKNIEAYKNHELDVLITVNILTEGVDLPMTDTVFLARPTVSTTLMTQMVGRALRGSAAGGKDIANIVFFRDKWGEDTGKHIAWVNPETLFDGNNEFDDSDSESKMRKLMRYLNIEKIEEFAMILNDSIDTSKLESVNFKERIPVGTYYIEYTDATNGDSAEEGIEHRCNILVYNSTKDAYDNFFASLEELFKKYNMQDVEYLEEGVLNDMKQESIDNFFNKNMVPPFRESDIIDVLKYYACKGDLPTFEPLPEDIRERLDITKYAKHIYDTDMGPKVQNAYFEEIWSSPDSLYIKDFFGNKINFVRMLNSELDKITHPELYAKKADISAEKVSYDDLSMAQLRDIDPAYEHKLREKVKAKYRQKGSPYYKCTMCGQLYYSNHVQIDHIVPLSKGGKTVEENLQVLCRSCNAKKSDRL